MRSETTLRPSTFAFTLHPLPFAPSESAAAGTAWMRPITCWKTTGTGYQSARVPTPRNSQSTSDCLHENIHSSQLKCTQVCQAVDAGLFIVFTKPINVHQDSTVMQCKPHTVCLKLGLRRSSRFYNALLGSTNQPMCTTQT
jgi:hypothetical protein